MKSEYNKIGYHFAIVISIGFNGYAVLIFKDAFPTQATPKNSHS